MSTPSKLTETVVEYIIAQAASMHVGVERQRAIFAEARENGLHDISDEEFDARLQQAYIDATIADVEAVSR